jgi:hypothetical protein
MNKIKLAIPVHSFVDLITNSSSEIFTSATESTLTAAKEIINGILKAAGSKKTSDALFDISLNYVMRCEATGYEEMTFETKEARDEFCRNNELDEGDSSDEGDNRWSNLVIVAKNDKDPDAVATANKLANFFGTYSTWEQYN